LRDVEEFAREAQLTGDIEMLRKGALVAQSPHLFESIPEIDETDRGHLRTEVTNRWRHPKTLYFTIVLNSIAAAIQGWDQTGSNGANLGFPQYFKIWDSQEDCDANGLTASQCEDNQWKVGFINSSPYIAIALL
jgi:hypothetical protein